MSIAAFLPPESANYVRGRLARPISFARSWEELANSISNLPAEFAIVDPSADGEMNLAAVAQIQNSFQKTPFVAYVPVSNANLKAVFYLSRCGLREVFVHPCFHEGRRLAQFARRQCGHRLCYEFLGLFELRLTRLEPRLLSAVKDLFERPHRYASATDIGSESGLTTKYVYAAFQKAGIPTPWKLLTAARVLRAYAYMSDGQGSINSICREVGYTRACIFSEHTNDIFGCSPTTLQAHTNTSEALLQVVEWAHELVPRRIPRNGTPNIPKRLSNYF
jgi:AraC-like DNA-binding protein